MSRLYPKMVAVALMFVGMAIPTAYADVAELEARIAALEAEAASKAEAEIKKKPKVSLNITLTGY